jgi:hypothetical protein
LWRPRCDRAIDTDLIVLTMHKHEDQDASATLADVIAEHGATAMAMSHLLLPEHRQLLMVVTTAMLAPTVVGAAIEQFLRQTTRIVHAAAELREAVERSWRRSPGPE